jgi:hypothetical protein
MSTLTTSEKSNTPAITAAGIHKSYATKSCSMAPT